jgi:hypothetical protein
VFLAGGGPAEFRLLTRECFREWLPANSTLINGRPRPLSEMLVLCLTAIATEAGREVAAAPTRAKARRMVDEVLELMGQALYEHVTRRARRSVVSGCTGAPPYAAIMMLFSVAAVPAIAAAPASKRHAPTLVAVIHRRHDSLGIS